MKTWMLASVFSFVALWDSAGSTIRGTVTGPNGSPLSSVQVEARQFNGNWWDYVDSASTDGSGQYSLIELPAGEYRVRFQDWSGTYVPEWYDNVINEDLAFTIVVAADATVSNIDARLAFGSKITGTVTNAAGDPLEGVNVKVQRYNGSWWSWWASDSTDSSGNYTVGGLPGGKYHVEFSQWEGLYAAERYNDAVLEGDAENIPVPPLSIVSNINASLGPAAQITGTVSGPGGSPLLEDIYVNAYLWTNGSWENISGDSSDSNGVYLLDGLPPGQYIVKFDDYSESRTYAPEWHSNVVNQSDAIPIIAGAGSPVSNVNAMLSVAARISGTVTGTNGTTPVLGVQVHAERWTGSEWDWAESDETDSNGIYEIKGLAAGQYRVQFEDQNGVFMSEWYSNAPNREVANDIMLGESGSASNVNASLVLGAHITGTVTGTNGVTPIVGVYVSAYRQNGDEWDWTGSGRTDGAGNYDVGGLVTGVYRIGFWPDSLYRDEYYNDQTDWDLADTVSVVSIGTIPNINASLAPAGSRITGTVTGPGGTPPLQDILVNLYIQNGTNWTYDQTVTTSSDGSYVLGGLEAGTNRIQFMDGSGTYQSQWYDNEASLTGATVVVVATDEQVDGINASLAAAPQTGISGTVTDSGNDTPLSGLTIQLYVDAGSFWAFSDSVLTGPDGTYRFIGLLPGTYRIGFFDWSGRYVWEYFDNASDVDVASDIAVTDGLMSGGIDAALDPIPRTGISGTVTESGSGNPLAGIRVTFYQYVGGGWQEAFLMSTDQQGMYEFSGIWAGIYRIGFLDESSNNYLPEFYINAGNVDAATDVEVNDGLMTTGIDASLDPVQQAAPPLVVGFKQKGGGNWEILFTGGEGRDYILQNTYSVSNDWNDFGVPTNCVSGTNYLGCSETATWSFWRIRMIP